MRRRIFNALCLLSLLLAIGVAVLWARSVGWRWNENVELQYAGQRLVVRSTNGGLGFQRDFADKPRLDYYLGPAGDGVTRWSPSYFTNEVPGYGSVVGVYVPAWIVLLVLMSAPLAWLYGRRRRRPSPNTCPRCGYDLRGSSGPTCPECGEKIPAPQ